MVPRVETLMLNGDAPTRAMACRVLVQCPGTREFLDSLVPLERSIWVLTAIVTGPSKDERDRNLNGRLVSLLRDSDEAARIEALGASLVAISPQTPDNSLSTAEKNNLRFQVVSDLGNEVARRFGLVFQVGEPVRTVYAGRFGIDLARSNGDDSWELPIPGTFVIARDGTIRLAYVDADYTTRLEPSEILDCLRRLAKNR